MEEKLYCERCMRLVEADECEECGNKHLRNVEEKDLVFVAKQSTVFAGMLEDVFKQHNIPYTTRSLMGAGFTALVGNAFEVISFFVPLPYLKEAGLLVEELFGSDEASDTDEQENLDL